MTEADMARIEAALRLSLPREYRSLMLSRADDLNTLTHEINGKTYKWFDETLYLEADQVIIANLIERRPDSGTGYAFPNWWSTFFLVGSNGAGDYYCLRLDRGRKVWMIGSDCDEKPTERYASLAEFVREQLCQYKEKVGK